MKIVPLFYLLIIITALFFLSKMINNQLFCLLRKFTARKNLIYSIISLLYLPGTILHEFSHFFAATIMFLKVREIRIFPEFEKNYIKLGRVIYEKKDFFRGFLVGIAPIFGALIFFYLIFNFQLFHSNNWLTNIFLMYLIFSISSTMFSSKQDLVDFAYIIPFMIFLWIILYIFQIDDIIFKNIRILDQGLEFINEINFFLTISFIINFSIYLILKILLLIKK